MARGRQVNGNGSIRQRSNGRWEARYCVGRDPGTGKLIRKSIYADTSEEAAKLLRAATASIDENSYIEPQKMQLSTWMKCWIDEYCLDVKERTLITYQSAIDTHIIPMLGASRLSDIQPHMVQRFVNDVAKKGLEPKTVKNIHGVLHRALKRAAQNRFIRDNPADNCNLPRIEKKEANFIAGDDLRTFLTAIQGHKYEKMYALAVFTGMRAGEILGLGWDAVDFSKGVIKIKRQLQLIKGEYRIFTTKNSKARVITPAAFVMDMLKEQRKEQNELRLKAGSIWDNPEGLVFTDEIGRNVARNTLYMNYKRVLSAAGLPESLKFHDLRHSYAVFALEHGDNIKEIQSALGHYSSAFTIDTYAHVSEAAQKESAARKDAAITNLYRAQAT